MEQKSLEWHKSIELPKCELGIILENFILHIFVLPIFLCLMFSFNKCVYAIHQNCLQKIFTSDPIFPTIYTILCPTKLRGQRNLSFLWEKGDLLKTTYIFNQSEYQASFDFKELHLCIMCANKMQTISQALIMLDFLFHVSSESGFLLVFFGFFYFGVLKFCGL